MFLGLSGLHTPSAGDPEFDVIFNVREFKVGPFSLLNWARFLLKKTLTGVFHRLVLERISLFADLNSLLLLYRGNYKITARPI